MTSFYFALTFAGLKLFGTAQAACEASYRSGGGEKTILEFEVETTTPRNRDECCKRSYSYEPSVARCKLGMSGECDDSELVPRTKVKNLKCIAAPSYKTEELK